MTIGLLTEKSSQAKAFAAALGGMSGTYNGEQYVITHARGHLYELAQPQNQISGASPDEQEKLRLWSLDNLPWDLDRFEWTNVPMKDTKEILRDIASKFTGCDTVVAAGDLDPSGEGGLIFANVVLGLGLQHKKLERMYFLDESAASIQKAFTSRKPIASIDQFDEYRKASYRSAWDFASIQWTRIATLMGKESGKDLVLRQGRLKSAMVKLVGDQFKLYNDYVKKPFFQNRFEDDHKVRYMNPDEPIFDKKDQVPQTYKTSDVVLDGKTNKKTSPPRLLDLAGLSTLLAKQGVKPAQVLKVYQSGYERQYFSYPRTEDKTITPEQFKDLAPLIDKIAGVVGVDMSLLTHRQTRSTHVKPQGAHGANRPGLTVPASLSALEAELGKIGVLIYQALAKNYLAMLAEDYEYEQQKGHVKAYPDFKGIANVPKIQGWRGVFDADAGDEDSADENESAQGLGTTADPFIFEGANKRAEHPNMKWLMKQLEKRDVGTGATRTSTYAEVTSDGAKNPLLVDKRGKLTLAEAGDMSWRLLPGTHIGDLAITEQVFAEMKEIAAGTKQADACLATITQWVREDIETMKKNATAMRAELGLSQTQPAVRAEGVWATAPGGPKKVAFKSSFSQHEMTAAEIAQLLAGDTIEFDAVSKAGAPYKAKGKLAIGEFKGRKFVGFQLEPRVRTDKPTQWQGYTFSQQQIDDLLVGKTLGIYGFVSSRTGGKYGCEVSWDKSEKKIVPNFDCAPFSFSQREFSEDERVALEAGKSIRLEGFVSRKKGSKFAATIAWKSQDGQKEKIIIEAFG